MLAGEGAACLSVLQLSGVSSTQLWWLSWLVLLDTNLTLELLPAPEPNPPIPNLLLKPVPSPSMFPPLQLLPGKTTTAMGKQGHQVCLEQHKGISSFSFTHSNYFLDSLSLTGFYTSHSRAFLPGLRHLSLPRDNLNVQIPSSSNLVEENVFQALWPP